MSIENWKLGNWGQPACFPLKPGTPQARCIRGQRICVTGIRDLLANLLGYVIPSEEFLSPLGISADQLAIDLRVPATRINGIVNEKRGITTDSALRLSRYFGTTAKFRMIQSSWELEAASARDPLVALFYLHHLVFPSVDGFPADSLIR
jgi:antitoxin HigA-1